jgi:hypothetical protein
VVARRAGAVAVALVLLAGAPQARAAGPTPTAAPTVGGSVAAGNRLEASVGTWTSSTPIAYAYQWFRCDAAGGHCTSVHGATAPGYALSGRDVGKTIGLTVTASDAGGSTAAYASLVGPVAHARPLLVSTAQPQVTGLAVEGKTLQVTTGAWSPVPTAVSYTWQRCNANGRLCIPIAGASSSSYTVGSADVGHALASIVQASFGTTTQWAFSSVTPAALGADVAGPSHGARPAVSGVAQQGEQLVGSTGVWTGIGSLAYRYQWYRCDDSGARCSAVRGATAATYRTAAADVGRTLAFGVRATDSTGTAAAYSSVLGPIAPKGASIAAAAQPSLSGAPAPGSRLTVDAGTWRPWPGAVTYAWRRCNAAGRICAPIAGADRDTYTVTAADVGHAIVAVVSATIGATTQPAYSTASAPVA